MNVAIDAFAMPPPSALDVRAASSGPGIKAPRAVDRSSDVCDQTEDTASFASAMQMMLMCLQPDSTQPTVAAPAERVSALLVEIDGEVAADGSPTVSLWTSLGFGAPVPAMNAASPSAASAPTDFAQNLQSRTTPLPTESPSELPPPAEINSTPLSSADSTKMLNTPAPPIENLNAPVENVVAEKVTQVAAFRPALGAKLQATRTAVVPAATDADNAEPPRVSDAESLDHGNKVFNLHAEHDTEAITSISTKSDEDLLPRMSMDEPPNTGSVGLAADPKSTSVNSNHESSAPVNPPVDTADQIRDAVLPRVGDVLPRGRTEIHVQLHPPELGEVRVHLVGNEDHVTGRLVVRDEGVRAVLESQLPLLRQRLEDAGVSVGRLDVSYDGSSGQSAFTQDRNRPGLEPRAWSVQGSATSPALVALPRVAHGLVDLLA